MIRKRLIYLGDVSYFGVTLTFNAAKLQINLGGS